MASFQQQRDALTLKEALSQPRQHRDMKLAHEPMPNFKRTANARNGVPITFKASWSMSSRPRRIALLLDDAQEEYRAYAEPIIDNLVKLVEQFRAKSCPIVWSSWARQFDDGISNGRTFSTSIHHEYSHPHDFVLVLAMDRWYGPRGFRPQEPENAVYIFEGQAGLHPLKAIAPTQTELDEGWFYHSMMLDMFWVFRPDGKSCLDEKLKVEGIDTVVIAGLCTDECIIATAYAALSRGYDVIVNDAVATATSHHDKALTVMGATCGIVVSTEEVVSYMCHDYVLGEPGAVKGIRHPDGRKDDDESNRDECQTS